MCHSGWRCVAGARLDSSGVVQHHQVTTDGVDLAPPLSRTRPTVFDLLDISLFEPLDARVRCSG